MEKVRPSSGNTSFVFNILGSIFRWVRFRFVERSNFRYKQLIAQDLRGVSGEFLIFSRPPRPLSVVSHTGTRRIFRPRSEIDIESIDGYHPQVGWHTAAAEFGADDGKGLKRRGECFGEGRQCV